VICKIVIVLLVMASCVSRELTFNEIQVTIDHSKNHDLDDNDNFSPDNKWLVYDTRTDVGGIGASPSVERVNIETGEIQVLYEIPVNQTFGPGAGAANYHPSENKVIFIHGLPHCTEANPYRQWRRTGVIVRDDRPNVAINMDARDVTFPYTPGALRGGTHRHEWSHDGKWIGFTYNDAIMKKLEDSTGVKWNLRTLGVANQSHKVKVDKENSDENVDGTWFSAVVVRVVPNPKPGSDEISNASSDSWIGTDGYKKPDGSMQRGRAFLGKVNSDGIAVEELFVVDIPDSINIPGEFGPLEGTRTTFPMPPRGTVQRRLTWSANSKYPGCSGIARSSPDGNFISYLCRDKNGILQVFLMAPTGGSPIQLTEHVSDVQSGARWMKDGHSILYVWDNSIIQCDISDRPFGKRFKRLTARTEEVPLSVVVSNDGNILAFNRFVHVKGVQKKQIFVIKLNMQKNQ